MEPSIGRIVHYNSKLGPAAAIVIYVNRDGTTVDLQVFRPDGTISHVSVVEYGTHLGGWQWPPRV